MHRFLLASALMLAALPAAAQPRAPEPEWRQAVEQHVLLRVSAYDPRVIRLEAGRPTRLVFVNSSQATLSLRAPGFFSASRLRSGDADALSGGGLTLAPGERREIVLVPHEGRYRMRSRNLFRRLVGMSALIIVEPARAE